ncbi:MAG: hypothetical protein U5K30_05550 [Acidimicrobiales bacterium]|nr:hypothetical protein [Acidimicrobiales bacterium]
MVISLGPHHSFPLADVPRYLTPDTIRTTLTQAVLDQPIFQSRWRWNLNRSLVVLRFRGGKKVPPPLQRMQSDDMLAAVFPGAAACQENVTGPIEVPDHPLPRQTVHDALTEALDGEGLAELWRRVGEGEVRFHFVDSTEPSLLAHEILTARPYAFLDDGEAVDRRTNAVPLRRGMPATPPQQYGRVTQEAVERVRAEIEPAPTTPDELHDLLAMLVLASCPEEWRELLEALQQRGRVASTEVADGSTRWHTAEATTTVRALLADADIDGCTAEEAATQVLRGHLEVASPLTEGDLVRRTGLRPGRVASGLAALESEGFAIQGRYTERAVDTAADEPDDPTTVEWSSRRLLARMHSYSRAQRRRRVEPVTAQQFMRFALGFQHVTGSTRLTGAAGVAQVIGQLQGYETAAGAWEQHVLARRVRDYQPGWLDRLCHQGEVTWLRLRPPPVDDPDRRVAGASKATPVSLVLRADLPWLLAAHRGDAVPPMPERGAVAELIEVLGERGACFASELAGETGRLPTDIEAALWEGMARGLIVSDGFESVRAVASGRKQSRSQRPRLSRLRTAERHPTETAGRWSLVPPPADVERDELAEALADQLLARWGVVFYDLVAHEHPAIRWRDLQWALRRMEDRGLVSGGRFVRGFSGEQFALPQAAEALKAMRRDSATEAERTVCLSGADPLNLTGVILPGDRVPARAPESFELPT